MYPKREVISTLETKICIHNVTEIINGGTVIRAIVHTTITAKRELTIGHIIQRGGPTITPVASIQISFLTLAPGAAAETLRDSTGGVLILGVIPAVAPLQQKENLITTSLVESGNTKQDI